MKNWTVNYSIEEKFDILEKEWLPIVIQRTHDEYLERETIKEDMYNLFHFGIPPIRNQHLYKKIDDIVKTFEEYLNQRPILKKVDEIIFRSEGIRFI